MASLTAASHVAFAAQQRAVVPSPQRAVRPQAAGAASARGAAPPTGQRLLRRHPQQRCRASPDPFGMPSKLFESEMFRNELSELTSRFVTTQSMIAKFPDFDLEGKKIFIDQLEQLAEKLQIVMTRMQLADDPLGNEFLRMQRVQMLEAGTSMAATLDGFKAELEDMRKMVQLEENCADAAMLDRLKRAYRQKFEFASKFRALDAFDDPELMEAALDPEVMKAASEVMDDPKSLENWRHKPRLYALLQKMLELLKQ